MFSVRCETTHVSVMVKTIQLIDSSTGNVINEMKLEREAIGFHFGHNRLVFVHKIAEREHLLSVWRAESSLNLTHLEDVAIEDYDGSLQVDEMYITVKSCIDENAGTKTFNFISMKTFQVERSLSLRAKYFEYDGGYLFVLKKEYLVGVLDVASGTFLHGIRLEPTNTNRIITRANSNYVVIVRSNWIFSKLYVSNLKCLKETETVPSHLLLTKIELECQVKKMLMNETRIVCLQTDHLMCADKIYVVNLKPIDRLRCPEPC